MNNAFHAGCCDGAWRRHPLLTRMLGLCPLLAVSDRVVTAVGIGTVLFIALLWTQLLTASTRYLVPVEARLSCQAVLAACGVTILHVVMQAYFFELSDALGIYLPVVAGCCLIIARAEEFAARQTVPAALVDSVCHGFGIFGFVFIFAALREAIGYGTLLRDASMLWPALGNWPGIAVFPGNHTLTIAAEPAGALLIFGGLAGLYNAIHARRSPRPITHNEQRETQRNLSAT